MGTLKAGAVKVDITPDYPVWMDGNPRDRKSERVHDPISARALVLEGEAESLALVSVEVCGLPDDTVRELRKEIAEATGIPVERQVIACAHIHSGPATVGSFCPREEEYSRWLRGRIAAAVCEAKAKMMPALAASGSGEEYTISEYRRLWTRDGRIVMNWDEFAPEEILGPAGPTDPEVGVVRINAATGGTIAVLYNHAGHPNTPPGTWFQISGDYPAYASDMIERRLGGVAVFTNGAQGSVDIPAFRERDWPGMERKGAWLGREVIAVAEGLRPHCVGFAVARSAFRLAVREVDPEYVKWARKLLAESKRGPVNIRDGVDDTIYAQSCLKLVDSGRTTFDIEMVAFTLGGAAFVTIPGELYTEIGLRIKKASPMPRTLIVDLANGSVGYIPTSRAIREGGYAEHPGCSRVSVHADDILTEEALALLGRLKARVGRY